MRAQVCLVDCADDIARRDRRGVFFPKQIANPPEHVAAVVKRNYLHRPRQRNARFEIQHGKGVAANRHRERIEKDKILFRISKLTFGYHNLTWTSFFETKTAQRSRAA